MPTIPLLRQSVNLNDILLDPNNPRFYEIEDWEHIPSNMYHIESVQNMAFQRMDGADFAAIENLKKSIISNGYIPAEMIIVKPYEADDSKYVVIEGNRRLTAIRSIVQNSLNPATDPLVQSLQNLDVLIYQPTDDASQDSINEMILQGIRHIEGPIAWGAYQKANLIVRLHDDMAQSWAEISQRLGIGPRVSSRYYRAYKALRQMIEDEEFGEYADRKLFTLFDEALRSNSVKEWLGWREENNNFSAQTNLHIFYSLIVGDPAAGVDRKISNPQEMRRFSNLIASGNKNILSRFINSEISIEDADRLVSPDIVTIPFRDSLVTFTKALADFPLEQLKDLGEENLAMLDTIIEKIKNIKDIHAIISANK